MPVTAPWAHLPNASHIDRILADVKTRPDVWAAARDAARNAVWDAARDAAWAASRDAARDAARNAVWDAARNAAWAASRDAARDASRAASWAASWAASRDAAWAAVVALVAWDDVAYILDLTPDACRMLIETDTTHHKHAAVLVLPACIVSNS